jgi:hypothetical protein
MASRDQEVRQIALAADGVVTDLRAAFDVLYDIFGPTSGVKETTRNDSPDTGPSSGRDGDARVG